MPDAQDIVINTSPLIALVAALGDLSVLQMYRQVWVPLEVSEELARRLKVEGSRLKVAGSGTANLQPSNLEPATDLWALRDVSFESLS